MTHTKAEIMPIDFALFHMLGNALMPNGKTQPIWAMAQVTLYAGSGSVGPKLPVTAELPGIGLF